MVKQHTKGQVYANSELEPGFPNILFGILPTSSLAFLKHLFAYKNSILWPHESLLQNYLFQNIGYRISKRLTWGQKE